MIRIRPSSLPMLARCSRFESGKPSDYAEQGTARHAALAAHFQGDDTLLSRLDEATQESLRWAADYIRSHAPMHSHPVEWEQGLKFTSCTTFEEITGTADCICGPVLFDLKWRSFDYTPQMAAYAVGMFARAPRLEKVEVHILFGESMTVQRLSFDADTAVGIVEDIIRRVVADGAPTPCNYCAWCGKAATCEAMVARVESVVGGRPDWGIAEFHASKIEDPAEMSRALDIARALAHWIEAIEFKAREMVVKGGRSLPNYRLVTTAGKTSVHDLAGAYQAAGVPQEVFLKACTISLPKLAEGYADFSGVPKAKARRALENKIAAHLKLGAPVMKLMRTKE